MEVQRLHNVVSNSSGEGNASLLGSAPSPIERTQSGMQVTRGSITYNVTSKSRSLEHDRNHSSKDSDEEGHHTTGESLENEVEDSFAQKLDLKDKSTTPPETDESNKITPPPKTVADVVDLTLDPNLLITFLRIRTTHAKLAVCKEALESEDPAQGTRTRKKTPVVKEFQEALAKEAKFQRLQGLSQEDTAAEFLAAANEFRRHLALADARNNKTKKAVDDKYAALAASGKDMTDIDRCFAMLDAMAMENENEKALRTEKDTPHTAPEL